MKCRIWDEESETMYEFTEGADNDVFIDPFGKVMRWSQGGMVPLPHLKPLYSSEREDANGKEIYEGDLLLFPGTNRTMMVRNLDVLFIYAGQYLEESLSDLWGDVSVIGNLYENPKLLMS